MNESMSLALAALGGGALGGAFFGGLYWTTRRGIRSTTPALWFSGSLLVRTALVLVGFYAISGGDWHRLIACLPGFVLARVVVTHWGGRSAGAP
jgi:F1F0 ATPase subunit 2